MVRTKLVLRWIILTAGVASLIWTILLHGQLYGFSELPYAGSTILITLATLLLMVLALITSTGCLVKKGFSNKMIGFLNQNADFQLAVLIPIFLFTLIFLFLPDSLHPFEAFIHQISLPLLIYFLLVLFIWIISAGKQIIEKSKKTPVQENRVLEIHRSQLHRNLWVLFVFLSVSNFLASFIISFNKAGSFSTMLSSHFLVENEASIYTYVSAIFLLLISIGFGILIKFSSKRGIHTIWFFLSTLFLVFSLDEFISIHEGVIAAIRLLGIELTSSAFAYLIPVGFLILLVLYLTIRTIIINRIERWGLFLAGFAMLIGGAVFVESFTESLEMIYGEGLMPFLLVKSLLFLEEGLELTGTFVIFFFVMDQFFGRNEKIQLTIGHPSDPARNS